MYGGYDQADLQAITVIHELGHAANYTYGQNSAAIFTDGSDTTIGQVVSVGNSLRVMQNCP